jgi:hypothetical protein
LVLGGLMKKNILSRSFLEKEIFPSGYASINNKEEPVVKDGYAVQVAVLNSKKTQEAFPGLDDLGRFYWVLEDVKYKYRLGTYPTVIRAGQVKDKAVTRGYKDAFVRWQPETILFGVSLVSRTKSFRLKVLTLRPIIKL